MKTQIFLMQNLPVIIIGFLLFVTTMLLGCDVFFNANHVMPRDSVLLTLDDLYKIGLTKHNRIPRTLDYPYTIRGTSEHHIKERSVIAGFEQGNSRELTIEYWLFDSSHTAKKAAEANWTWLFAGPANFHPELDPKDVIGDATWRRIHRDREKWERGPTDIYVVKYNLLIWVRTDGHSSHRLQDARDIARHIEAKIAAVLKKNKNTNALQAE